MTAGDRSRGAQGGAPRIASLRPWRATPGGRIHIDGGPFTLGDDLPIIRIGNDRVRAAFASSSWMAATVPASPAGGATPVRIDGVAGETAFLDVGRELVTGVHAVDSPLIDVDGSVFVTCSGSRGQQTPVSIYRITPGGTREIFATGIINATSLAFDPQGAMHVTSRFDGSVMKVARDGTATVVASGLGITCGLAFAADGTMYVGDRPGTVHRLEPDGEAEPFATLPPSMAAYHMAVGHDGTLFVSVPTLSPRDAVYGIDPDGEVAVVTTAFGRPQGLAVDPSGDLYVVDAVAGGCGLYRIAPGDDAAPELVVAGAGLVGVAFDRHGGFVLSSGDTVWRFLGAGGTTVTM